MIAISIVLKIQKQTILCGRLILLIFILASCRELIDEPFPDFNPLPVVNALLIEGDSLSLNISMAEKLDTSRLGFVDFAEVELFINDQFVESLTYTNGGEYRSTTVIEASKKYTCVVSIPGFDPFLCEQLIPAKPRIIKVEHINIAGKDEEGRNFPAVELTFENKPENRSFYEVAIYHLEKGRDTSYFRECHLKTITDPVLLNEGLPLALFSNVLISDSSYTMHINYTTGSFSGLKTDLYPLIIELRQTTEDYYRYKKQLHLYENGLWADGVLISMTNNNLFSNIEDAYGIYAAYNVAVTDTIIPNLDGYENN